MRGPVSLMLAIILLIACSGCLWVRGDRGGYGEHDRGGYDDRDRGGHDGEDRHDDRIDSGHR